MDLQKKYSLTSPSKPRAQPKVQWLEFSPNSIAPARYKVRSHDNQQSLYASNKPNHYFHLFYLPFRTLSLIYSDRNSIIMVAGPFTSRSSLFNHPLVCLGRTGLSNRSFALILSSKSTTSGNFSWWSQPVQSPPRLDFSGMRRGCCSQGLP
ncbi:hypothetical protein BV22DRAFT_206066 [Leucogyrophana mollusca]|uniref:Uncharacterized protein n=1 Tax=Leucogyrophana mollusca TaxID=85980 RepID=A0ACB8BR44_9AGAM|nr:hypothetical protein BV22DRAFT_206066 [Leucogyrophana mollusca]